MVCVGVDVLVNGTGVLVNFDIDVLIDATEVVAGDTGVGV
jgi:hypothetical protein